jgi:hypothetical protein
VAEPARAAASAYGGIAALADEALFEIHYDAVAAAIADRFALQTHYNIAELQNAHAVWIATLAAAGGSRDHHHFIRAVGLLIASLASHRIITYSVMVRPPGAIDRHLAVVLKYPNEVTALAAGTAAYAVPLTRLTGQDPSIPLPALVIENAAGILRRRPEAATRFRELLQLTTPWS